MKRKLGLIFTIFFVGVQLLGLLHLAEYGFEKHEHHGQVCSIYLAGEQSKYSAAGDTVSVYPPEVVRSIITFPTRILVLPEIYPPSASRAPPVFLHS